MNNTYDPHHRTEFTVVYAELLLAELVRTVGSCGRSRSPRGGAGRRLSATRACIHRVHNGLHGDETILRLCSTLHASFSSTGRVRQFQGCGTPYLFNIAVT